MTLAPEKTEFTFEEFLALPDSRDYELVGGRLVERKTMGVYANFIAAQILTVLNAYCRDHKAGAVFNAETLYRCFGSPNTTRKADVSYVRRERLSAEHLTAGYFSIAPDLVVEVTSPNDLVYALEEKLADYRRAGVPLAWVVHPNTRSIRIHRLQGPPAELFEGQVITGESVLPGFSCPVSDFFPSFPPT
jgi:Uma2 family endonuclease